MLQQGLHGAVDHVEDEVEAVGSTIVWIRDLTVSGVRVEIPEEHEVV